MSKRKSAHWALIILATVAMLFIGVGMAWAQDGDDGTDEPPITQVTDDEVNVVARKLYCPVCENIPLDVCPTQACADWRSEIRTMLEQGRSEGEILAYFENRYGQRVLATPQRQGFSLILWVLPPLGVLIGIVALVVALRRMAPSRKAVSAGAPMRYDDLDAEYVARLESDLLEL